jgi:hypothetical protein
MARATAAVYASISSAMIDTSIMSPLDGGGRGLFFLLSNSKVSFASVRGVYAGFSSFVASFIHSCSLPLCSASSFGKIERRVPLDRFHLYSRPLQLITASLSCFRKCDVGWGPPCCGRDLCPSGGKSREITPITFVFIFTFEFEFEYDSVNHSG